ncbi:type 1 fimbrial protein [Providencia rustigianii]|uniref:fimbrial protein n=1 Tax=Providencia rustigianii TaxID=158850 RepID=UPI000F6E8195|nr:fimbrial protein [Providencia rustigianii]MTC61460.1 type 1 fimbrial protein [Providencia rustigianii]VEH56758.1 PAP fimbrial minor pilin protein precursor [Providencia rustigianii]
MRNFTKLICSVILFINTFIVFSVHAIEYGAGRVTMVGEITDAACTISMDSRDQIIDMGVLPIGTIRQEGVGPVKDFEIQLVNCDLVKHSDPTKTWHALKMTFEGAEDNGLFQVFGEARGVGLFMQDARQQQVIPGESLSEKNIIPPSMRLSYTLRLTSNFQPLRSGHYQSFIRFKVDYY